MDKNRRILVIAAAAMVTAGGGYAALDQLGLLGDSGSKTAGKLSLSGGDVLMSELMKTGPLPDLSQGADNAPVTMIEYASATCPHCKNFHELIYPQIRQDYIDTGKVRFIFREYPLDPKATTAFMVMRCAGPERHSRFLDAFFATQNNWATSPQPVEAIFNIARSGGFNRAEFDACLANEDILNGFRFIYQQASGQFGVAQTPTFFINGEKVVNTLSYDQFRKIIEAHLGG